MDPDEAIGVPQIVIGKGDEDGTVGFLASDHIVGSDRTKLEVRVRSKFNLSLQRAPNFHNFFKDVPCLTTFTTRSGLWPHDLSRE